MNGMLPAPRTVLFERELPFRLADVFVGPVVVALTDRALQADEIRLRHEMG